MDSNQIKDLTEAYLSVYDFTEASRIDTHDPEGRLWRRNRRQREENPNGSIELDRQVRHFSDRNKKRKIPRSELTLKAREATEPVDEDFRTADTGNIAAQAYKKERGGDEDYKTLDTATRHLSAPRTKPPSKRNLMRRDAKMAILRARIAAGHEGISDVIDTAERTRRQVHTDPELQKQIMHHAANIGKAEQRRRSIQAVKNMQTRRKPSEQEAQSASVRMHDTYVKSESYEIAEAPFRVTGPHPYSADGRTITPSQSPSQVGKDHKNKKTAQRRADKENEKYGAYAYRVTKVDEDFKDLTPEKESRVRARVSDLAGKLQFHHDSAKKEADEIVRRKTGSNPIATIKGILVGTRGPGKRGRGHLKQYRKYRKHFDSAQDALARTQASRDAAYIHKRNELRQKIRNLGGDPDVPSATSNIRRFKRTQQESYEILMSHLINEGYASTPEAAEKILECMSESWMNKILSE